MSKDTWRLGFALVETHGTRITNSANVSVSNHLSEINKKKKKQTFGVVMWSVPNADSAFTRITCCCGSSADTHSVTSPAPRTACAASWPGLCSAPSPPRREWGNPAASEMSPKPTKERKQHHCDRKNKLRLPSRQIWNTCQFLSGTFHTGGPSSSPTWPSGTRREVSEGRRRRRPTRRTEPSDGQTSCSSFFLAASSFFSFLSASAWQANKGQRGRSHGNQLSALLSCCSAFTRFTATHSCFKGELRWFYT